MATRDEVISRTVDVMVLASRRQNQPLTPAEARHLVWQHTKGLITDQELGECIGTGAVPIFKQLIYGGKK